MNEPKEKAAWMPPEAQVLGKNLKTNALIVPVGKAGVGKSHLCRQLLTDPEYGPDEVMIFMAEDATSTYRVEGAKIVRVKTFRTLYEYINTVMRPLIGKVRWPKAIFVDSLSGMADYERINFNVNPEKTSSGERDKRAEFGIMGYSGLDLLIMLRDLIDSDIIAPVTSYESGPMVELAIEGKLLPKNLARLTNLCLHMKSEKADFDPQNPPAGLKERPWRTVSWEHGLVINRYFLSQDSGEFLGKGHENLDIRLPAYLPDVLRLIHDKEPLFIPKKQGKGGELPAQEGKK